MLIAHFSDTHIQTGPLAAEPARQLHRALGRVLALDRRPDCVVITGDVANVGAEGEYEAFRAIVGDFPIPIHLVTGNHDDPKAMVAQFGGSAYLGNSDSPYYAVEYPDTCFVALDTNVPNSPGGHLGDDQLSWLDQTLARTTKPTVVALHHPPIPIGIRFLDSMGLDNADDLLTVLTQHNTVGRILAGHIHRTIIGTFAGSTVAVASSLYRQSALTLTGDQPPGYLHEPPSVLLHLLADAVADEQEPIAIGTAGTDVSRGNWLTHQLHTDVSGSIVGFF